MEAARAGAERKGVAVVTSEVMHLAAKSATDIVDSTKAIIQTGMVMTADTADSLHAISDVSIQISTIADQLAAVQG